MIRRGVPPLSLSKTSIVIGVTESVVTVSFTATAFAEGANDGNIVGEALGEADGLLEGSCSISAINSKY